MDEIQCNTTVFYNTYESTLKRLVQILKSKTSDNVKQLEDLWDSINTTNHLQSLNHPLAKTINNRISPTISSTSQSPIHLNDSSNDSTNSGSNSSNNNLKREASKMCSSPVNSTSTSTLSAVKKPKIEANLLQTNSKLIKTSPTSFKDTDTTVILTLADNNQLKTSDVAVDMLDITCTVCKNFNQEPNNKLIECRQCTHLYHQLCHNPKIGNEELEQQKSNDDQMVWYLYKCSKCITKYENEQIDLEVDKINSTNTNDEQTNSKSILNKTNGAIKSESKTAEAWNNFKKTSPTNLVANQSSLKSSTSLSSFSTLSNANAINNNNLNSSANTISSNGKSTTLQVNGIQQQHQSTNGGIKGFAALASKLNPNSNLDRNSTLSTTNPVKKPVNTATNPDSLFKKFKESASTTNLSSNENEKKNDLINGKKSVNLTSTLVDTKKTATASTTSTNSLNKPLVKNGINSNALNGSNTNSTITSTTTTTNNNLQKKNPFNISNSLTTSSTINSSTTKTSTISNNNCVGLNNLKEKNKTQLKTTANTANSITTNSTSNTSAITRSSKIS